VFQDFGELYEILFTSGPHIREEAPNVEEGLRIELVVTFF
jgi:hypothetical protein